MTNPPAAQPVTAREAEVLGLLQRRFTNAEIAAQLFVSVRTVETHVSALLRKHGVADRRALGGLPPLPGFDSPAAIGASNVRLLPTLRTALVGRADELAVVAGRVRGDRLTTLVGPGGVGKTTLALAVAHAQQSEWPDGVVFVDLVPTRTATDVLAAVACALGVEGDPSSSHAALGRHLAGRRLLIVADNCEHVIDAIADLVGVALAAGDGWHVLATSREPLNLHDEHLVPVEPLGAAAAELFVTRASQSEPRVAWNQRDERVINLCARLDGLPLAVELAAGQLRRWSLDELSGRLEHLTHDQAGSGSRGHPRHQTMNTAIGWSYGLLDDSERWLLRHLGVFPSHFDIDAVTALRPLLTGLAPGLEDTLALLVDKSLVTHEPGSSWYRLLETIRAFALARLIEEGERTSAFEHHRRWTVGRATASSKLDRWISGRLAAQQHVDAENVRQAFWSSVGGGHFGDAVELAVTRSFLWRNAVGCAEGRRWLDALAAQPEERQLRAWVALGRADIGQGDGDFLTMVASADDAALLAEGVDADAYAVAQYFRALPHLLDPTRADQALEEVLAVSPDGRLSNMIHAFFIVAHVIEPRRADLDERSARLRHECSADGYDRFILNWAIWLHGLALRDPQRAEFGISEQYEFLRATGLAETWLTSYSLAVTQMIDGVSGRAQLARALDIASREGHRIEGDCLLALAYSEACRDEALVAAQLLGLARTCRFNATAHHVLHSLVVAPVIRNQLEPAAFLAALEQGKLHSVSGVLADRGIRSS